MRRTLYLLAAMVVGATTMASAQVRPVLIARSDTLASNPYGLLVHVGNLLSSAEWSGKLDQGYTIQMHWKVQLWKRGRGILSPDVPQAPTEWDTEIQALQTLQGFVYTDRAPGRPDDRHLVSTLDSLKAWLSADRQLRGPKQLDRGDWYFVVHVDLSALTPDDVDNRAAGVGGGLATALQKLIVGGSRQPLDHDRIRFTVPR